jgi:inorganic pyrophosphatase
MNPTSLENFWHYLDILVANHKIVIDRPVGSSHPRYPEVIYPVDYGYLEETTSTDKDGIDVWIGKGSSKVVVQTPPRVISALILTVDLVKNDAEIKIALNCSEEEIQTILSFHNSNKMGATVIRRPMEDKESV